MKKIFTVLLSLLMVLALAACSNGGGKKAEPLADESHAAWVVHGQYLLADGTENGWNGKDTAVYEASSMTAISLDDVKALDEALYNTLSGKDVKYLYMTDVVFGTNDAGWTTDALIDGKMHKANGSYAFKVAQCSVDQDGDNTVYAEDQWISDPKTAYAESLTPATLFMPVWQEEADENGFSWASNPVVIGGPGLYTLVCAQYNAVSAAGTPGYGIGLVKKEDRDGIAYEEILEWIAGDHTYEVIGGFNGWADDGVVAMEAGEDGKWTADVELAAGDEFKVRADSAWDYSWGAEDGANLVADEAGTYTVTIDFSGDAPVVSAVKK